jgi:hypothetical protein
MRMKLKRQRFSPIKEKLSKYKDKIEITAVYLAANIPSFLLAVNYSYKVWIPGTLAIYAAVTSYPFLLKCLFRDRLDLKRQKEREAFALTEFGAGIPAVLAAYGTFNWLSNGATNSYVTAVCGTWLAGRAVGVPTWIVLHKNNNPELYENTGWKTGSIVKSVFNGFKRKFSESRVGAVDDIMELWVMPGAWTGRCLCCATRC